MRGKVMALVALSVVLAACDKPEASTAKAAQAKPAAPVQVAPQVDPAEQFQNEISGVWAFDGGGLLRYDMNGIPYLKIGADNIDVQLIDVDLANGVLNLQAPAGVLSLQKITTPDGPTLKLTTPDGSVETLTFVRKLTYQDQMEMEEFPGQVPTQ